MKIKDGFILREVADSYLVVAVGKRAKKFNGLITLNETGAFLWEQLSKGSDSEQLVKKLLAEYDIDETSAKAGVSAFLAKLQEANLLEEKG